MTPPRSPLELQNERNRALFEIESLEREIRSIDDQFEEAIDSAEPSRREGSDWWRRARDAKNHKEKQRRVLLAREARLARELARIKPDAKKAEAKSALKDVLKALFMVARSALAYYDDDSEVNETAFTDALDQLDKVVPGWESPKKS